MTLAAGIVLIVACASTEAHAGVKDLLGEWRITSVQTHAGPKPLPADVEIIVAFQAGGKLELKVRFRSKRRSRIGTYRVKGRTLTMTLDHSSETVTYRRVGKKLVLVNSKKRETTVLMRR
jgi:uncharacterized protein (TIGR03066 family)